MQPDTSKTPDAIQKMRNLLSQTQLLLKNQVAFDDQQVKNMQYQINQTIRETFGPDSVEFNANKHHNWLCNYRMKDDDSVKQKKFSEGILKMSAMLEELIAIKNNKVE